MKTFSVVTLMMLLLMSYPPAAHAQSGQDSEHRMEERESGILPALFRLIERTREERAERQEDRANDSREAGTRQESAEDEGLEEEESASTSSTTAPLPEASQPSIPSSSTTSPSQGTGLSANPWGATTTPILNTHSGNNSTIYANEWPLTEGESGVLLLASISLVLFGLMLAEREPLRRAIDRAFFPHAVTLSEKRTALS